MWMWPCSPLGRRATCCSHGYPSYFHMPGKLCLRLGIPARTGSVPLPFEYFPRQLWFCVYQFCPFQEGSPDESLEKLTLPSRAFQIFKWLSNPRLCLELTSQLHQPGVLQHLAQVFPRYMAFPSSPWAARTQFTPFSYHSASSQVDDGSGSWAQQCSLSEEHFVIKHNTRIYDLFLYAVQVLICKIPYESWGTGNPWWLFSLPTWNFAILEVSTCHSSQTHLPRAGT